MRRAAFFMCVISLFLGGFAFFQLFEAARGEAKIKARLVDLVDISRDESLLFGTRASMEKAVAVVVKNHRKNHQATALAIGCLIFQSTCLLAALFILLKSRNATQALGFDEVLSKHLSKKDYISEFEVRFASSCPLYIFNVLYQTSHNALIDLKSESVSRIGRFLKYLDVTQLALALRNEAASVRVIFYKAMSERAAEVIEREISLLPDTVLSAEESEERDRAAEKCLLEELAFKAN